MENVLHGLTRTATLLHPYQRDRPQSLPAHRPTTEICRQHKARTNHQKPASQRETTRMSGQTDGASPKKRVGLETKKYQIMHTGWQNQCPQCTIGGQVLETNDEERHWSADELYLKSGWQGGKAAKTANSVLVKSAELFITQSRKNLSRCINL